MQEKASREEKDKEDERLKWCERAIEHLITELEKNAGKEQRTERAVYRRLGEAARAGAKDALAAVADAEVSEVELFGSAEMSEGEIED